MKTGGRTNRIPDAASQSRTQHSHRLEVVLKLWILVLFLGSLFVPGYARGQEICTDAAKGDPRWQQLDGHYARIERATIAKNPKELIAVYAPKFKSSHAERRSMVIQGIRQLFHLRVRPVKEKHPHQQHLAGLEDVRADRAERYRSAIVVKTINVVWQIKPVPDCHKMRPGLD